MQDTLNLRDERAQRIKNSPVRQLILSCSRDESFTDHVRVLSGNNAQIYSSEQQPFIGLASNGFDIFGSKDFTFKRTSPDTVSLIQHAENFLLYEMDTNGQFQPKSTIVAPLYEYIYNESDRYGKVHLSFDGATHGTKLFPNAYNNDFTYTTGGYAIPNGNSTGGTSNASITTTTTILPGTTSCLRLDGAGYNYAGYYIDIARQLNKLKTSSQYNEWTIGGFFRFDNPQGTQTQMIFSFDGLDLYLETATGLIKGTTAFNQGAQSLAMIQAYITAPSFGGNNSLNLGTTNADGSLKPNQTYHIAISYDGLTIRVYLNGWVIGGYGYWDGTGVFTYDVIRHFYVNGESIDSNGLMIGQSLGNGAFFIEGGYVSHVAVDPFARYGIGPVSYNFPATESAANRVFEPTIATCTGDIIEKDRNYSSAMQSTYNKAVMFNFENGLNGSTTTDFYGNKMWIGGTSSFVGTCSHIDNTTSKFGTSSLRLVGNTDLNSNSGFFQTAPVYYNRDWTIELWFKPDLATTSGRILRNDPYAGQNAVDLVYDATNQMITLTLTDQAALNFFIYTGTPNEVPLNTWTHIAITGDGTNFKLFVNGNFVIQSALQTYEQRLHPNWSQYWYIGLGTGYGGPNPNITGWIDDFAILPVCKYTASFTPPTSPNVPLDYNDTIPTGSTNIPGTLQYFYDIPSSKMYKGYKGNFQECVALFVGEAYCSDRAEFALSYSMGTKLNTTKYPTRVAENSTITFAHNFGTDKVKGSLKLKSRITFGLETGAEIYSEIFRRTIFTSPAYYAREGTLINNSRNTSYFVMGADSTAAKHTLFGTGNNDNLIATDPTTTLQAAYQDQFAMFVEFERLF